MSSTLINLGEYLVSQEMVWKGLMYIIVVLGGILVVLSIMRFISAHKALKLYADHIKATMNLPEVVKFINKVKKPLIEVDEDKVRGKVIVIWRDSRKRGIYPSVIVYVDKYSKKPLKIETYPETPGKKPGVRVIK